MTTIVYHRGILAADSMVTAGGRRFGFKTKIAKRKSLLAAACGSSPICRKFIDWFRAGMKGNAPSMKFDDDISASAVIFTGDFRFVTFDIEGVNEIDAEFFVSGSGSRFALGALEAGLHPADAVRVATKHDLYTGGDILTLNRRDLCDEPRIAYRDIGRQYEANNVVPFKAAA